MTVLADALTDTTFDYLFFVIKTLCFFGVFFFIYSYFASFPILKDEKTLRKERRRKAIKRSQQNNNIVKLKK